MSPRQTALHGGDEQTHEKEGQKLTGHASVWVLMGFVLWIGFFIGAIILHAMVK